MIRHAQRAVVTVFRKLHRLWQPSSATRMRFILLLLVVIPGLIPIPANNLAFLTPDAVPKGLGRNPYYVGRLTALEAAPGPLPGGSDEVVAKTATNVDAAGSCEAAERRVSNKGTISSSDGLEYTGVVPATSVVFQFAERGKVADVQHIAQVQLYVSEGVTQDYRGMHRWGSSESPLIDDLLTSLTQSLGTWLTEEIHWGAGAIEYLAKRSFGPVLFLPTTKSWLVANTVGIEQLGTLCVVALAYCGVAFLYLMGLKLYWNGHKIANIKIKIARLCAIAALLVGCRLIVQSDDACRMIDTDSNHCQPMLFCAMGATFKCAVIAAGSFAHNIVGPLGTLFPGAVLSYVSSLMLFGDLGVTWMSVAIMITQLTCILLLRAAQTLLFLGQCVLLPFFLVSRSAPRSKRYGRLLIKSLLVTTLWNISWFCLVQVQSVIVFAELPPWAKICLGILILQLMILAPVIVSFVVHLHLRHPHKSLTRLE